jgi:polyribonucleotide nucleotidyltransferase
VQAATSPSTIHELVRDARQTVWAWQSASQDEALIAKVGELAGVKLQAAYQIRAKRRTGLPRGDVGSHGALKADSVAFDSVTVEGMLFDIEAKKSFAARSWPASRDDGRDTRTVRAMKSCNSACHAPTALPCSPAVKPRRWW